MRTGKIIQSTVPGLDSVAEKSWKLLVWCTEAMKQNSDAALIKGENRRNGILHVSVPSGLLHSF